MKKQQFIPENGSMTINSAKMAWKMMRTQNRSVFGIRGSRIFYLLLTKDGVPAGEYDKGWIIGKTIDKEDEESTLCLDYLIDRYGNEAPRKKKEMGLNE